MSDSTTIHPTALVSPEAHLGDGVSIGAYAVIDGPARVGDGCQILAHAQLIGDVRLGEKCVVGRASCLGEGPQDVGFDSSIASGVRIGRGTTLREQVTIHRSSQEGGFTTVGEENFLMVGVHLGHDVVMGDGNVVANNCLLAGHVQVGDRVFLGGGTVVHQFVRLGDRCLTQGNSAISKDVPPFVIAYQLNRYGGLNVIGLRRAGFSPEVRKEIRQAIERLLRSGKPLGEALEDVRGQDWGEEARRLIDFVAADSRKGVLVARAKV